MIGGPAKPLSPFQKLVADWKDCTRCPLHKGRCQVVFLRGQIPAKVMYVGEAPGDSEDAMGAPFKGPAGHLLDRIVRRALVMAFGTADSPPRMAYGNLVGCFPRAAKEDPDSRSHEPPDEAIVACGPRLRELVRICDPSLLVTVGSLARDWLDPKLKNGIKLHRLITQVGIVHPASILRANDAVQGIQEQRCVVTLANALEDLT